MRRARATGRRRREPGRPPARVVLLLVAAASLLGAACVEIRQSAPGGDVGDAGEPGAPPDADAKDVERQMERFIFDRVNAERRERGLHEYVWDDQLAKLAQEWSEQMADERKLEHQDTQRMLERSEGFEGVGENIFRATGAVPAGMIHVGWMRSDGHRVNVLQPGFDRMGVGVVCLESGRVWATERFGRTAAAELPPPTNDVPPQEPIVTEPGAGPRCPGGRGAVDFELESGH